VLDPEAAQNVPLANPRYVERALEICLLTGQPQSALRQNFAQTQPWGRGVVLSWEREALYARINERVLMMMEAGVLAEVAIFQSNGGPEKAIGVKELRAHLAGECTLAEAVEAMQQATRRYAKAAGDVGFDARHGCKRFASTRRARQSRRPATSSTFFHV
jgi:tRNA dimethylallyltransferase